MKLITVGKKTEVDMTKGSILSLLCCFALPLLFGNLFQQLYNTVDTLVVGQYVGKVSFAAVGTINPIINTLIGFFMGFSTGAGVVISKYFGAKDQVNLKKSVHTFVAMTLVLCVVFTAVGLIMIPLMLRIVDSPVDVALEQAVYLKIYFWGVSGLLIYNMGSAILRAVGNSTYPFIFLVVCALLNIVLDFVFVLVFKMGTDGVAYATIISQFISALLVAIVLFRTESSVRVKIKEIRIDWKIASEIMGIALPVALQMSITAFSNVFVQSYINYFGTDVMGGWTAYNKLDTLIFMPLQSIALGVTTFVSQNIGSRKIDRARKGVSTAIWMSIVCSVVLAIPTVAFAPQAVSLLIDSAETEVIRFGTLFMRLNCFFLITVSFNQVYGAALKGAGKARASMFIMLFSFVVFRQIYLFVMTKFIVNTPVSVAISYPVGWIVCSIISILYYFQKFPKQEKN